MKVLLVTDGYYPYHSGTSKLNYDKWTWLRKRGIEADILTTSYGKGDGDYEAYRIGRVVKIAANGSYITMTFDSNLNGRIKSFLREHRYDILHLSGPFPPGLSYFAMRNALPGTGVIGEFQAASDFILRSLSDNGSVIDNIKTGFMQYIGGNVFNALFRDDYERLNIRSAISHAAQSFFEIFIRGDYEIIPVGVDTDRYCPEGPVFSHISKGHSIIYLGRMDRRKGLDRLIRAMPRIIEDVPDVKLYAGGGGPLLDEYRKLAVKTGVDKHIDFMGYIDEDDLPKLYRSGSVYVSPATGGESFGIVLIEAMASGIPVIASDIGGYRDVVDNGLTGILTDSADSRTLAKHITGVLLDSKKAQYLSNNALEKVSRHYDWDVVIDKTIEQYKRAIVKARS
ncbi:MAG: glycosyltransferase family 4 protein [bacterium]